MATITQRGEKWQAKIRRDGYPPISKSFLKKVDAEAWARKQEAEMDRGAWQDRSAADSTTVYKLLERYMKDVVPSKRGAEKEAARIRTMMGDTLARYKLSALTPLVLSDWRDRRLAAGVSGSTVNRELNIISAVLNYARKELMIAVDNPVAAMKRPAHGKARERRLEDGEEARLLEALEPAPRGANGRFSGGSNPWMLPIVQFALETAMRRGELLALTWENVDLKKRVALLEMTKTGKVEPCRSRLVQLLYWRV